MSTQARNTDPDTSAAAAQKLQNLQRERQRILTAFAEHGDMTDSELEAYACAHAWPHAGTSYYYRRRRSDLKSMGLIEATDMHRTNTRGNSETVWTTRKDSNMNHQPASLDEGNIIFRKFDDEQWAIEGVDLVEGETVTVYTKENEAREVVVREIIETNHGVDTALFEWVNHVDPDLMKNGTVIFHSLGDDQWAIRGLDLVEGEEVEVTTKAGKTRNVIVGDILDVDDNLITARFEWAESAFDDDRITFTAHPSGNGYLIRGTNLVPGTNVPVVKRVGKPVRVVVGEIVSDEDGRQLATFTWPDNR
ncbi:hypothetical protein [Trueperella pyogenes]|uniref:hypothetical protein n=1 Tax=Trueperella pyogenes TaxID=1661 RepID=UPI00345C75C5